MNSAGNHRSLFANVYRQPNFLSVGPGKCGARRFNEARSIDRGIAVGVVVGKADYVASMRRGRLIMESGRYLDTVEVWRSSRHRRTMFQTLTAVSPQ